MVGLGDIGYYLSADIELILILDSVSSAVQWPPPINQEEGPGSPLNQEEGLGPPTRYVTGGARPPEK